jgi:hypothetical protein
MGHVEGALYILLVEKMRGNLTPLVIYLRFLVFGFGSLHGEGIEEHNGSSREKRKDSCCIGFTLTFLHDFATCA